VYGEDWSVSGAEGVTSVAVLRDQATSIGVDVYNMLNDVVKKILYQRSSIQIVAGFLLIMLSSSSGAH
jgi:hypothetical protein